MHSRYPRWLADAPISGQQVVLRLEVRRFFCDNTDCPARTFAEQITGLTSPHARRTGLLRRMLEAIGLALAGRAGARLARRLGLATGRDGLLRLVRALDDPLVETVPVLGVDDFALRRRHVYATVLVDMATHRPVDLLTDRTASAFAGWLGEHPGVEVICRDRASAYAEGARTGAPEAIQVADRFHLWANLGEAVERPVIAHRACLPATDPTASREPSGEPTSGTPGAWEPDMVDENSAAPLKQRPEPRLVTRTRERHAAVAGLLAQRYSLNGIGRELGLGFRTVQRFARAATPEDLLVAARNRSSNLDRFKPYVHQRWNAGCTDATVLHTELADPGWHGSLRTVPCEGSVTPTGCRDRPRLRR